MRKTIKLFVLICGLFGSSLSAQNPPVVAKVEPPNWWAGHTINPVRLLVRGKNMQNSTVRPVDKSLTVSNIRINQRGDYIFFDVGIRPDQPAGKYEFELENASGRTIVPFEILPPLSKKAETITNDDVIYLIMTDRFADGDPSNNKDADRKNPRAWHGGDFKGITKNIPYLKELGITAIWLTPWYDNPDEANLCDKPWCPNTNYHGYHAIDYYGVENHFGTMEDLREMIRACQQNGIKVIQDQVANHVGVQHPWAKSAPLENWFSKFEPNTFDDTVLLSPNSPPSARDNLLKGWFNEFLPDLNQFEPEVARYEIQNALWWIGATGIDGIRQDTIQYMPREFIRDWSQAIRKQYPDFYLVGEVFEEDPAHTAFFQGGKTGWDGIDTNLPSVFDFKLWRTSQAVFTGRQPARALRDVLKYDGIYPNINNVTLFANNHDTDRFMSLPGATKAGAKLHLAFVLATRGIPQLYYGEEILMTGGHDPDNRKDFTGGWPEDPVNKFTRQGRTADEQESFEWVQRLIAARKKNKAIREGQTIDVFYDDNVYAFRRKKDENDILFIFNSSDQAQTLSLDKEAINAVDKSCYSDILADNKTGPGNGRCPDGSSNKVDFTVAPRSMIAVEFFTLRAVPGRIE